MTKINEKVKINGWIIFLLIMGLSFKNPYDLICIITLTIYICFIETLRLIERLKQ